MQHTALTLPTPESINHFGFDDILLPASTLGIHWHVRIRIKNIPSIKTRPTVLLSSSAQGATPQAAYIGLNNPNTAQTCPNTFQAFPGMNSWINPFEMSNGPGPKTELLPSSSFGLFRPFEFSPDPRRRKGRLLRSPRKGCAASGLRAVMPSRQKPFTV